LDILTAKAWFDKLTTLSKVEGQGAKFEGKILKFLTNDFHVFSPTFAFLRRRSGHALREIVRVFGCGFATLR
jgi:hypothetical protein